MMGQENPMVETMDQENPIMKKETLPGINTKLDAKAPVKKMDPMYDGKPGVQQSDFAQFSDKKSPVKGGWWAKQTKGHGGMS